MNAKQDARPLRVSPLGCSALLFESEDARSDAVQQRVWRLAETASAWTGVREAVPGMNNLLVIFEPALTAPESLTHRVNASWLQDPPLAMSGKLIELPVVYGGARGPDLVEVAEHAGLDVDAVVRLHSTAVYTVYFLGAHPGFAYLGGLDAKLQTPRRAEPRLKVEAGTVAIGGMQTGVIAQTTPSGWQLIGATGQRFFDPTAEPPALLAAGDRVRFLPIGIER
jgi:KipI family sensor histidine kinase inhibitor